MLRKSKLTEIYKRFGFTEENTGNESIAVYSIKTGHYHNADILPLNNEVNVNQTFEEYRQLGYACQIKKYQSYEEAHKELFNGFFSVDSTKEGANKRGNSSRLTQSFHFFMFEPIFSPVNALNQPI